MIRDVAAVGEAVEAIVASHRGPVGAAVWIGGAGGPPWYTRDADTSYPTASVIKAAYLVELFAAHAGALDAPAPQLAAVLDTPGHPALAPFSARQLADIRRALGRASVRRLGAIMMARLPASNHVYNAAANLATAILGGPEGLTRRLHAREPAFAPIVARRYMLADRDERGDNTASAAALGAVVQRLAAARAPGVDARTARAMQEAVRRRPVRTGIHRAKSGYLPSAPVVSAFCGWRRARGRCAVYVVLTSAPRAARGATDPLVTTATRIRNLVLRRALPAP